MDFNFIAVCIAFVVTLIVTISFYIYKNKINWTDAVVKYVRPRPLITFTYPLHMDPFPQKIEITNPYECTPEHLRECKMNDPYSCVGCKNLIATCTHFEKNMKYVDYSGQLYNIEKNATSNDGYCIAVDSIAERCNVYHGSLVLVQKDKDSTESWLLCSCNNPGYIGNDTIDGTCNSIYMCNGKIDDINQPFDQIKCVCKSNHMSAKREDNVPTCKPYKVYDSLTRKVKLAWRDDVSYIRATNFDKTIWQNTDIEQFVDPCTVCPLTGNDTRGRSINIRDWCYCLTKPNDNWGVPIRRNSSKRLLKGDFGPDAILAVKWTEFFVYTKVSENQAQNIVYTIDYSHDNADFYRRLDLSTGKTYAIDVGSDGVWGVTCGAGSIYSYVPSGNVYTSFTSYTCQLGNPFMKDDVPSHYATINNDYPEIKCSVKNYVIPDPPSYFLWDTDLWKSFKRMFDACIKSILFDKKRKVHRLTVNKELYVGDKTITKAIRCVGFAVRLRDKKYEVVLLTATDMNMYNHFMSKIIDYE